MSSPPPPPPAGPEPVLLVDLLSNRVQTDVTPSAGNALQACVASIFTTASEDPLMSTVPNFIMLPDYFEGIKAYASTRGYVAEKFKQLVGDEVIKLTVMDSGKLVLLRGKSPRGSHGHVVVARIRLDISGSPGTTGINFDMVHDPHPDGTFLDLETEPWGWFALFKSCDEKGKAVEDVDDDTLYCAVCGKEATAKCAHCQSKSAAYCNRDCQKKHWKNGHKYQCARLSPVEKKARTGLPDEYYEEAEELEDEKLEGPDGLYVGRIVLLTGLSRADLNGLAVEVMSEVIVVPGEGGAPSTERRVVAPALWPSECFLNPRAKPPSSMRIQVKNLALCAKASPELVSEIDESCDRATSFNQAKKFAQALDAIRPALEKDPTNGLCWNCLSDTAALCGAPTETVVAMSRRSAYNTVQYADVLSDRAINEGIRICMSLLTWSGVRGEALADYEGERRELKRCLKHSAVLNHVGGGGGQHYTCFLIACSFREQASTQHKNELFHKSYDWLMPLLDLKRSGVNLKKFQGHDVGHLIEDARPSFSTNLSFNFFDMGMKIEESADKLPPASDSERVAKYEEAKILYEMSHDLCRTDPATLSANARICKKLGLGSYVRHGVSVTLDGTGRVLLRNLEGGSKKLVMGPGS